MFILESTRRFLKLGRDFTGSIVEKTSRAGAKSVRAVQRSKPKIRATGMMQPHNAGSPFGRTAVDIAGPLRLIEEGNKYRMKVKGYGNCLQEKLSSVHEMLSHKNGLRAIE